MTKIAVVHKVTWTSDEWLRLKALGNVRYSPGLPSSEEELLARIGDAQIVISATIVPFTGRVIERSPRLGHSQPAQPCLVSGDGSAADPCQRCPRRNRRDGCAVGGS